MGVKGPHAESPRFPVQRSSGQGESAPKARQRCVADGKRVNIPAPLLDAMGGRIAEGRPGVGSPGCPSGGGHQANPVARSKGRGRGTHGFRSCWKESQEKPLSFSPVMTVPQTDTGGRDEYSKALGRTREKELGKMVP